jgi:hypothetical protein
MGRRILDPARRSELRTPQKRLAGLVARVQAIDPRTLDVFPLQGLSTAWGADTTGGAFGAVWQALATRVSHPAMFVRLAWATGAGTTGEIRVVATGPGGSVTSSVLSLGAASSSTDVLGWQPGLDVWLSGALTVNVEVRRTAAKALGNRSR